MGTPPLPRPRADHLKRPEPNHEQHIRELRQSALLAASNALKSCAKVLERAAEALAEEEG